MGRLKNKTIGRVKALYELVNDGLLNLSIAARKAGQSEEEFRAGMAALDAATSGASL